MRHRLVKNPPFAILASLAIGACLLLGHAEPAGAATITAADCSDSGTGSLRAAVARAGSGDTIDLRRLRCTIVLTGGAIDIPQQDLALAGPGAGTLTITTQNRSRVLLHEGTGTLRIASLSIVDGSELAMPARGGCIRSEGNVTLQNARVHACTAGTDSAPDCYSGPCSEGGAIYARGTVRMSFSTVSDSRAMNFYAYGGGVEAAELRMYRSRLLRNTGNISGGAQVLRFIALASVISGNTSSDLMGGGAINTGPAVYSEASGSADVKDSAFTANRGGYGNCSALCSGDARIVNSTFSANVADYAGAISVLDGSVVNSTIVHNRIRYACGGALYALTSLYLESTILADNPCGIEGQTMDLSHTGNLIGAHNLVRVATVPLPADTLRSAPLLGPLADNGGPTPTHALLAGSPAINTGSNPLLLDYDQRGPGFARTKGSATDIGAFER